MFEDSPNLRLLLASALTGAGSYGLLRGYRSITGNTAAPPNQGNSLEVTLPKDKVPKNIELMPKHGEHLDLAGFLQGSANYALPVAAMGTGLIGGFKGAQGLNTALSNKSIDLEKEKVKNDYLQALQRAAVKTAGVNTPHTDEFIKGMMKKADDGVWGTGPDGRPLDLFHGLMHAAGKGWDTLSEGAGDLATKGGNALLHSKPAQLLGAGALLTGGGTAAATYYLANRLDRNKEEARQKSQIPTEVHLNVR